MFRNLYCGTYLSGTKSAGPICRVQNRTGKCPYNASDGRPSPLMKYYTGRVKRVAPLKRPALLGCFDRRRPIYILIIYTTCIRQWHAYDRHYTFISHAHITNRKPTNLDVVVKIVISLHCWGTSQGFLLCHVCKIFQFLCVSILPEEEDDVSVRQAPPLRNKQKRCRVLLYMCVHDVGDRDRNGT